MSGSPFLNVDVVGGLQVLINVRHIVRVAPSPAGHLVITFVDGQSITAIDPNKDLIGHIQAKGVVH